MSKVLRLISPIPPSVNHHLEYRVIKKGNRNIVVAYKSLEQKKFEKQFIPYVIEEAKKQCWEYDDTGKTHYYNDWVVYFPRIDMDASNYDKVLCDSITESKCVWKDDNIVLNRVKRVYYDSKNPRIELEIHPVEYMGIFDNKDALKTFENKCKKCSRYKRNCSILKKAKEGRIQNEINNDFICSKYKGE